MRAVNDGFGSHLRQKKGPDGGNPITEDRWRGRFPIKLATDHIGGANITPIGVEYWRGVAFGPILIL
jgi:hypothetical protein